MKPLSIRSAFLLMFLVESVSAQPVGELTYIKCKFTSGPMANIVTNFYIDEKNKRLLNDNKSEFGKTQAWSGDTITVSMPVSTGGIYITFINRLTGEFRTFTEGRQMETLSPGKCNRAPLPKQQF
jgi:hypothetical protein